MCVCVCMYSPQGGSVFVWIDSDPARPSLPLFYYSEA